jgi:hypothetical protein
MHIIWQPKTTFSIMYLGGHVFFNEYKSSENDLYAAIESYLSIIGRLADRLFLKEYMTALLATRNQALRHHPESD